VVIGYIVAFSPESKTVFVDMDGVLFDLEKGLEERMIEVDPEFIVPERTHFYMEERVTKEFHKQLAHNIVHGPDFFANLELIDGAQKSLDNIKEMGFYPRILSAPIDNAWCAPEKRAALEKFFGSEVASRAILDRDKWKHDGIALIDDKPAVEGAEKARWQHIVFTEGYNTHVDTDFRLENWHDPKLETLLGRCADLWARNFS
jgi:5'-nucleotidase